MSHHLRKLLAAFLSAVFLFALFFYSSDLKLSLNSDNWQKYLALVSVEGTVESPDTLILRDNAIVYDSNASKIIFGGGLDSTFTFYDATGTGVMAGKSPMVKITDVGDKGNLSVSGNVAVGRDDVFAGAGLHVVGSTQTLFDKFADDTFGSGVQYRKGRGSPASPLPLQVNDVVGIIQMRGWKNSVDAEGFGLTEDANVRAVVESVVSTGNPNQPTEYGTRIEFVNKDTSKLPGELRGRPLVVRENGNVGIGVAVGPTGPTGLDNITHRLTVAGDVNVIGGGQYLVGGAPLPTGGNVNSINALTAADQTLTTGTSGSDFNINSVGSSHTFNLPDAGALARGLVSVGTQAFNGIKTFLSDAIFNGNVGIGVSLPTAKLDVDGQIRIRGGVPGLGKVLTSDANGLATWENTIGGGGATGKFALGSSSSFNVTRDAVCSPNGNCNTNTAVLLGFPLPFSGTIKNFYASISTTPINVNQCVFTVRKSVNCASAYSDTVLTCAVIAGQTSCNNTVDTAIVSAGECLQIFFDEQNSCAGFIGWGFEFEY